jgi:hypothetical protein
LCGPCKSGLRVTPYQLSSSTDIVVAELRGEVISTLSLVRDGELGLPMEAVYPEEIEQRRRAGVRLAEVSCLADRRQGLDRFFGLFCEMSRVIVQMADREGFGQLLIAVHPRHAKVYARTMTFARIGDYRDYPAANGRPAVPMCLDLALAKSAYEARWLAFVGAPLADEIVRSRPISAVDKSYFNRFSQRPRNVQEQRQTTEASDANVDAELNSVLAYS